MKKTIAKLMAAAMLLSAVPAVTMPSFVSQARDVAATNTTTATYQAQFFGGEGNVKAASDGEIFSYLLPGRDSDNTKNNAASTVIVSSEDYNLTPVASGLGDEMMQFISVNKVILGSNNLVHVKATLNDAKMTAAQKTAFVKAVRENTNTFKVRITRKNVTCGGTLVNKTVYKPGDANYDVASATLFADGIKSGTDEFTVESQKVYSIGGTYDGGKIKTGVADEDGYLMDGNVYAVISKTTSDGIAEVELLKQDNNEVNKLKNNDQLRGKLLKLNIVKISGVTYKVGKLGSQALKEAKMKKIQLKNCSKVGKGALRKCKQLRNVNLKDKNKVRKIHTKAFYDCKNLRSVTIDARKLNTVGKDAFGKVKKNCKIKLKASKSKYNDCVKKIKKSGAKNVKYSRLAP